MRSLQKTLLPSSSAAAQRWPEDSQAGRLEGIDDARSERPFRTDDRQPDLVLLGEADQRRKVVSRDRHVLALDVRARVARRDEHSLRPRALRDFPGQGVLPATAADDEDVH